MSSSLRDVPPIMDLAADIRNHDFQVICTAPHMFCKVFEDNAGALELARLPKLHPCTKHINVCYHHFRKHVHHGKIKIFPISTNNWIADLFTKALAQTIFVKHHTHKWVQ